MDIISGPFRRQAPSEPPILAVHLGIASQQPRRLLRDPGFSNRNTYLQTRRKPNTIPNSRAQANEIQQRARAMHTCKALVERKHILAMRRGIDALLAILRLLRLAEANQLRRLWADEDEVEEAADEGGGERVEHAPLVCGREGAVVGGCA